jgi:isochorismate synthase
MVLYYRIPGAAVITLRGQFHALRDNQEAEGFIVSNANGTKRYVFEERTATPFHVTMQNPPSAIKKEDYINRVQRIIKGINTNELTKVVYSRVLKNHLKQAERLSYFTRLTTEYPKAFVYYFEDENLGSWVGATPEILIRRIENHCFIMSLAGTKMRNEAREWTEKERIEQELVTTYILEALTFTDSEKIEVEGPYDHAAGPVEHLRTDISFYLDPEHESFLIHALHPTPAVCGLPKEKATQTYEILEAHNRELYTGYIGVFSKNQTHCYVNLRCAKLLDDEIYAYVGGGITNESNPELEWDETENKSKTLFDLL